MGAKRWTVPGVGGTVSSVKARQGVKKKKKSTQLDILHEAHFKTRFNLIQMFYDQFPTILLTKSASFSSSLQPALYKCT